MKNKKIVFLVPELGINYDQSGGAGTHIRGTIDGLKKNNIDVLPVIAGDIFGIKNTTNSSTTSVSNNTVRTFVKNVVPLKLKLLFRDIRRIYFDYKFENKVIEQIMQYAPDAIYERSALFSTCGLRLSKKLNIPLIIESDGCMPEIVSMDFGLFSIKLANLVEKYKLKKANYISAYNEFSKLSLAKKFDVSLSKIIVKPLGVCVLDNATDDNEINQLKQHYGIDNKKVVGFVGAISKYHGVDLLLECASILHNKNVKDIAVVIVGWSKEAEQLKLKAEELHLTNLIFTGRVDKSKIPLYYKMFDVGVIPNSEPTIYPVKVLEYGAFGLCPVVPDYEVFHEIITNKEHGVYFQKNNPTSLANILIELFEDNSYSKIAIKWQQKVLLDYTWENTVKRLATLIHKN